MVPLTPDLLYLTTSLIYSLFFFNDTATTEIYTLSLHDALPISGRVSTIRATSRFISAETAIATGGTTCRCPDRKSTRLNSSHSQISYAVFCLKKKKMSPPHLSQPPQTPPPCRRSRPTSRSSYPF